MNFRKLSAFVLTVPVLLFLISGCVNDTEHDPAKNGDKFKVGLVLGIGGRGDKSFNDSAYEGLQKGAGLPGVYTEYVELSQGQDRESAMRLFAARGFDLIFGIGFMFTDDITVLAREYPGLKFACIDYSFTDPDKIPSNLAALRFAEEEGSFLVGVIASLVSETGKIGFVGGMDIPLIHKFEAGYRYGALYVNPMCEVLVSYAGVTADAFRDPARGKELALAQYNKGAEIIFHAAGSTGFGVFEAARETGRFAIGVDADQYQEAPRHILTSMIKRVDIAVYDTIRAAFSGDFTGGLHLFGVAEEGIGYIYDDNNRDLIPAAVIDKTEELREQIIEGAIQIPVD